MVVAGLVGMGARRTREPRHQESREGVGARSSLRHPLRGQHSGGLASGDRDVARLAGVLRRWGAGLGWC